MRTQPLSAVFALHHAPAAVLPSVPGRRGLALATAPVGALGPTGRPLCPLCPTTIHCDTNIEGCHHTGQPQLMTSSSSDWDRYSLLHLLFCSLSYCIFMDFSCLAVKKKNPKQHTLLMFKIGWVILAGKYPDVVVSRDFKV